MGNLQQTYSIPVSSRTIVGKRVHALRADGFIPAVVYGHSIENKNIVVSYAVFEAVYRKAGESSLVDVSIDGGAPLKTLIHDVVRHPTTERYLHVDFYQVTMTEKLNTQIQLEFFGEAKAVKELGGILVKNFTTVDVRCLPGDLVHEIEVDLSTLKTFDDIITLGDISLPHGIEILGNPQTIVATVTPPLSEEQLKALEEKPVEDVSVVTKVESKKKGEDESKTSEA